MQKILKDAGLSELVNSFEREKITPDLIPKLSKLEFQKLGLTNLQKMMELRVKCSLYCSVSDKPERCPNTFGGAPKFHIPRKVLADLINEGVKDKEMFCC